ncbi:hypothetical protein JW916_11245 [Candidatus Sumerlaeota bacterium]|nr:hypothetical protein [Candidatus Sumerlaeota bacterium]
MSLPVVETMVKMVESLPVTTQEQVVEHLREYIEDIQDEARWEKPFEKSQSRLVAAARRAKQEIAAGRSEPLDLDRL